MSGQLAVALGTLAVAAMVAALTYLQYWINKLRLRHELFDRRFAIFKTVQGYLSEILIEGGLSDARFGDLYPDFLDAGQRSRFLFDKDIPQYLDSIRERSIDMRTLTKQNKHDEASGHLTWLLDQMPKLFDRFSPYMKFPVK